VEVHGGEWSGGRHGTGSGIVADCEKARAAARLGWIVLPIAGSELDKRPVQVLEDVVAVLEQRRTEAARG
jgi:very-short-patch-repair endonuclease